MFNMIRGTEETVSDFCILPEQRKQFRLLLVHISHILALIQYATDLSCLCRTHCLTADINTQLQML